MQSSTLLGSDVHGLPTEPTKTEFDFFQSEKRLSVQAAYARWLLRSTANSDDVLCTVCPMLAKSSVHIDDNEEAASVRAVIKKYGEDHDWSAVMTAPSKYPLKLVNAKRPNGHARVFDCALDEVTWLSNDAVDLVVARRARRKPAATFFKALADVLPMITKKGCSIVLALEEFREPDMAGHVGKLVTETSPSEAFVCIPKSAIDPAVYIVLNGVDEGSKSEDIRWRDAIADIDKHRQANIATALDLLRYIEAIGVETEAQCQEHETSFMT